MDSHFCVSALERAILLYGAPDIFNSDQGSQFTSDAFTDVLKQHHIKMCMDGKGRWIDNVFIERLWRSVKYEVIYLKEYTLVEALRRGLAQYFQYNNHERVQKSPNNSTLDEVYDVAHCLLRKVA